MVLRPRAGAPPGPVFILQRVPEDKAGKNRMHVDVHPPLEVGLPGLVERLEGLGGARVGGPVTGLLEELGEARGPDEGYDGSLADLAATAGWYDQNQFARDFTALVGTTPGAYRDRTTAV